MSASSFTTCIAFGDQARDAAEFYCSVFKNSKIGHIAYYPAEGQEQHGRPANTVMTVDFELNGQHFSTCPPNPRTRTLLLELPGVSHPQLKHH